VPEKKKEKREKKEKRKKQKQRKKQGAFLFFPCFPSVSPYFLSK